MKKRGKQNYNQEENGYKTQPAFDFHQNEADQENDSLYQTYIPQNPYDPYRQRDQPEITELQEELVYRKKRRFRIIAVIIAVIALVCTIAVIVLVVRNNKPPVEPGSGENLSGGDVGSGEGTGSESREENGEGTGVGNRIIMDEEWPEENLTVLPSDLAVDDTVLFGRYEQDNDYTNGAEEIEWKVLARAGDSALLISTYGLDTKPYNDNSKNVTWENCSLRKWLNDEFFYSAFDSSEQAVLVESYLENRDNEKGSVSGGNPTKDKVFLLSLEDIRQYYGLDPYDQAQIPHKRTEAKVTAYSLSQGAFVVTADQAAAHKEFYKERMIGENGWWWLRSPGTGATNAASVYSYGTVHYNGENVSQTGGLIRPAIWVRLG